MIVFSKYTLTAIHFVVSLLPHDYNEDAGQREVRRPISSCHAFAWQNALSDDDLLS